jgi:hypothetical protein
MSNHQKPEYQDLTVAQTDIIIERILDPDYKYKRAARHLKRLMEAKND